MKLLQIINSHAVSAGGAEKLAVQLHHACLERGIESHLLCLMEAPTDGPNLYALGFKNPYSPRALWQLRAFLKQPQWRDCDVIHVHLFPAQLFVALAACGLRPRAALLTTEHNTFNRRRTLPGARFVDRFSYRRYRKIVCISEGTRAAMKRYLPALAGKLVTIHNGIDLEKYRSARADCDADSERDEPPIVLCAARLTAQKNHEVAIRAVETLRELPFELWIAGEGEESARLKALVDALDLGGKIRFLGFRDDLPELYQRVDLFLSVSKWEGFGLSVVEAMASGLPVVVSDVPGVREVVGVESGSGLFVDPGAPDDVAAALEEVLSDRDLRAQMGTNARLRASSFDLTRTVEEYVNLYRALA